MASSLVCRFRAIASEDLAFVVLVALSQTWAWDPNVVFGLPAEKLAIAGNVDLKNLNRFSFVVFHFSFFVFHFHAEAACKE